MGSERTNLAVDIGNSNVVVGVFEGDHISTSWRFATDRERMPDEWWTLFAAMAHTDGIDLRSTSAAIISSVVPRLTTKIAQMIDYHLEIEPFIVDPTLDVGVQVLTDTPSEVGADRIVNTVAAGSLYGTPAIVVDFGTATTFDVVNEDGNYIGGAIAPGIYLALESLTSRAARLSAVELEIPEHAIGTNTVHSVQSGTVLGYLGLVEGLLDRISEELGGDPTVIATGGLGELFTDASELIDEYAPDLTLVGLNIILKRLQSEPITLRRP